MAMTTSLAPGSRGGEGARAQDTDNRMPGGFRCVYVRVCVRWVVRSKRLSLTGAKSSEAEE